MNFEKILFDAADGVAIVTFNRPEHAHAMDRDTMYELMHAAIRCDEDPAIRAVIITGNGRFFSAGGDLASFSEAGDEAGMLLKEMTTYYHAAISRFSRMNAPIIAAVNGVAAGAGFSLVAACDMAIAAESAMFTSAYTAAALTPDGSSTYFVPRLVGMRRAMELMLTNRRLTAGEALEWGLINRVVPDDQLLDAAGELAAELAAGGTVAYGAVKRMLHESFANTLETQMEMEARSIAAMSHTHDGREGMDAFLNKRTPQYRGE
ncbi:MAG TPA: enoyl-CoA hydratase-related protein [Acidimicrobiia bacterium]|jgi:2-(1,2-epoxy-1,2-dihydrophenyl)acetyl-CoA isomerase|nr:enoyl-CoA hydratase-related protein [Acidimicrobiia bacterium]